MKLRVSPGFDPLKAQVGPDEYFVLSRIDGTLTMREVLLATGLPDRPRHRDRAEAALDRRAALARREHRSRAGERCRRSAARDAMATPARPLTPPRGVGTRPCGRSRSAADRGPRARGRCAGNPRDPTRADARAGILGRSSMHRRCRRRRTSWTSRSTARRSGARPMRAPRSARAAEPDRRRGAARSPRTASSIADERLRILAMSRLARRPRSVGAARRAARRRRQDAQARLLQAVQGDPSRSLLRQAARQLRRSADATVFEAVSRAYAKLTTPDKSARAAGTRTRRSASEQPQTPQEYASELFERACGLEVGGDALGAMKLFAAAVRIDPQTRYLRRAASCALAAGSAEDRASSMRRRRRRRRPTIRRRRGCSPRRSAPPASSPTPRKFSSWRWRSRARTTC